MNGDASRTPAITRRHRTVGVRVSDVLDLLDDIERHRRALAADAAVLEGWIAISRELAEAWRDFTAAGGIGADDFAAFMHGQFQTRRVRQHRHMRLIADNASTRAVMHGAEKSAAFDRNKDPCNSE
jgi:hypothetical protein